MKIDVSRFLDTPGRTDRRCWVLPVTVEMPLCKAREAGVDILLEGCDDGIRIKGTVSVNITVNCYRCLDEWKSKRVIAFDRTVRRHPDADGYILPKDGWLELDGIVVDEVVISLPTAPLCEENCRGICSGCGVHLNAEECKCVDENRQSPFLSCPNSYRRVNNGCSQEKKLQDAYQAKKSGLESQSPHPFQMPAVSCAPTPSSGLSGVR